jgi:arylformamidase
MTAHGAYAPLPRDVLDREYSPSTRVASLDVYLDEYAALSASARRSHPVRTGLAYGPGVQETLDLFPGPAGGPLLVFVHGGNWQALTKDSSAFAAPGLLRAGVGFAAVDYGLAPDHPLPDIVASVRRCLRWLRRNAGDLGFAPDRIHLCGTSAGAHLAAMTLIPGPGTEPGPAATIAGVTLLSGMYDLEPVRHSYINDALRLDEATARRYSPLRHLPDALPPVVIARGGNETGEYARQHEAMATALRRRTRTVELVAAERNHFDLPYDLGTPGTALGDAVLRQIHGGGTQA